VQSFSLVDLLQSSGPIALNELVMRLPDKPQDAIKTLSKLQNDGSISIDGPLAGRIRTLIPDGHGRPVGSASINDNEILGASDTFIELSSLSWRRSFAS
jgi:hypothetical protein